MKAIIIFLFMISVTHAYSAGEPSMYVTVAASQTDFEIGTDANRVVGNYLKRLVCTVGTAATSTVSVKDGLGSSAIPLLAAVTPIGVYVIDLDLRATVATDPGFYLTTGAGATCVAVGRFFKQP